MGAATGASAAPVLRRLPFLIRLSPGFLQRVSSFSLPTGDPSVVDGILFGVADGDSQLVRIAQPFPSIAMDSAGQESEDASLDAFLSLARRDAGNTGLVPLGWYAIRSKGGLTTQDVAVHARHFVRPGDVFMIIHPGRRSDRHRLDVYCRSASGVLTLSEHRLGTAVIPPHSNTAEPLEVELYPLIQDDFYLQTYGEMSRPPNPARAKLIRWAILLAIFGVALAVTYILVNRLTAAPAGNSSSKARHVAGDAASWNEFPLGLQYSVKPGQQGLIWNGTSSRIRDAVAATLTIQDGATPQRVQLGSSQLRQGLFRYQPLSNETNFRLSVIDRDGSETSELLSVRPQLVAADTAPSLVKTNLVQTTAIATPVPAPITPEPAPTTPEPASPQLTRPVPKPRLPPVTPPVPVNQVLPDTREVSPQVLATPKQLKVLVRVDTNGHVYSAAPIGVTRANVALVPIAIAAAKNWTFQPARLNDRAVPGQHTIVFQFQSTRTSH